MHLKNIYTMGHKVEITQKHEFSDEDISDLLVTALEGGINYWCRKAQKIRNDDGTFVGVSAEDQSKVKYASDLIALGGKLKLYDIEDEDESWELDLPMMLNGIKLYCEDRDESLTDLLDNHDADTADAIVQFALFGKLEFS
jgi:hypothetical protein